MDLLTQNSKLKNTSKLVGKKVVNFGIPAYKTASGKITCPFADKCIKFCYAQKGAYSWSNVKPAFEERYRITQLDDFVKIMNKEILKKKPDYIRVHDSGDYYSKQYLNKWLEIAKANPTVRFYSYTNCVEMFKSITLPDNFDVIFSDSGKQTAKINVLIDRHTKIFNNKAELQLAGYIDASKCDLNATKWYNKTNKVGLIFH